MKKSNDTPRPLDQEQPKKTYERPSIAYHASLSSLVCGAAGSGSDGQSRRRPGQDDRGGPN